MSAQYQFHPRVHEQWGDQSLHFLLMNFLVSYDPRDLADALKRVFSEHEVTGQTTYELMGRFDLMLHIWIGPNRLRAFRASLKAELNKLSLRNDVLITVSDVVRHWPWGSEGSGRCKHGELVPPRPDALASIPPGRTLHLLNRLTSGEGDGIDDAVITDWQGKDVIAHTPLDGSRGIKLVTVVTASDLSEQELNSLERLIARTLDECDPTLFSECSLYRADSGTVPFVIMCRVAHDAFGRVREDLISKLQQPLMGKARTTTYPIVLQEVVPFSDAIAPAAASPTGTRPIEELLAEDESDTLEVKATAFAPIDPWLRTGEPLKESVTLFQRGVLKSVVAFLNSDGGTVVVGALEDARYRGVAKQIDERLDEFPVIGQYVALGLLDPSFTRDGWDKYARRLTDMLDTQISDNPVATGAIAVENATYAGRDFCLIRVEPTNDHRWYYATSKERSAQFYVRRGASVVELQGSQADHYKEQRQRARRG